MKETVLVSYYGLFNGAVLCLSSFPQPGIDISRDSGPSSPSARPCLRCSQCDLFPKYMSAPAPDRERTTTEFYATKQSYHKNYKALCENPI